MKKRNRIFAVTAASAMLMSGCAPRDYIEKVVDLVEDTFVDNGDDIIDEPLMGEPAIIDEPLTGDVPMELPPDDVMPPEWGRDDFLRIDPIDPESGITDL